jgi:4-amino-4-deoxy-L-arabinose transferase-like glycosyltransferase
MSSEVGKVDSGHFDSSLLAAGVVAALITGAIVLRFASLGADSFWLDEAYSVTSVLQHSARDNWQTSVDPNHPPLYFVVLWFTLHFGGVSEAVARLPSAVASVCNLALVFVLARRLGSSIEAAVWAVLLMAFAPLDVWYAQEARMYALVTTTALVFAIGLAIDSWRGAALAAAALTLGLYVDFTMVALSAILVSLWLVRWWHTGRAVRELGLVALAMMAGWLLFSPEWSHLGEVLRRIDTVPLLVNVRRWFGVRITPGPSAVAVVTLIATAAAAVTAAVWRALRHDRFERAWVWLVWAGLVGSTVVFAVPRGYSAKQFLATGWPFVVLIVAWSLTDGRRVRRPGARSLVSRLRLPAALAVSIGAAIVTIATPRADWRGAVSYLNQRAGRTAAVWLDPPWNTIPYDFYQPTFVPGTNLLQSAESSSGRFGNGRDVCLVAERFGNRPPTSPSEAWFDQHLKLVESVALARLEVRCYANP